MRRLPAGAVAYRRTPDFDERSVPAGLLRSHRTRAGTWGEIRVRRGRLLYRILEPAVEEHLITPGHPGVVEPTTPHEVELLGPVSFHVQFYRDGGDAGGR